MIIHLQFGFSQFISLREEDLWNFSQSEHIIGPGSHVEYPTGTKNRNFVEDHSRNIPAKFGSNWPSSFGEGWNVKSLDDGRQVMAIVHMDLWSRWTKNQPIRNKNRLWWPCLLTDRDGMSNLYRGPSTDASDHLVKRFQRRFLEIYQSEKRIACGGHVCWWIGTKMSTLYRGPPIDASYQVSVYLAKRFQRRRILKISQSETRVACGGHVW